MRVCLGWRADDYGLVSSVASSNCELKLYPSRSGPDRWATTDRRSAFLELRLRKIAGGDGLWDGDRCLFKDFVLFDDRDRPWTREKARKMSSNPGALTITFNVRSEAIEVGIALLFERGALVFSFSPALPHGWRVGLLLPEGVAKATMETDGSRGISLAWSTGKASIRFALPSERRTLAASIGKLDLAGLSLLLVEGPDLRKSDEATLLYFAAGQDSAGVEAEKLAATKALETHRREAERLLEGPSLQTSDQDFNLALTWASFSGRLLMTKANDGSRGIWAGLPWFRDNWGRDTFIALSGILLVRGLWEEAREVLEGFAALQDRNPESPTFVRIPNRYRGDKDVIYNTVDGSLWFVRALYEYAQASGDADFLARLAPTVFAIIDADLGRCDIAGFLLHADADTWMDARIEGKLPWSARGDRAVEVQGLFYAALLAGRRIASLLGEEERAGRYRLAATKLREAFLPAYFVEESGILADRLMAGDRDLRVRPNQFLALFAALPLAEAGEAGLIELETERRVLAETFGELVYPWGVATLSQEDPFFHGSHENPGRWHKDAAYHNGTVWDWLNGPVVSLLCRSERPDLAWSLLKASADRILSSGCAGSLAECADALPGLDGSSHETGTFSQAWSLSEFARNAWQDILGFRPRLLDGELTLAPSLPPGIDSIEASAALGIGARLRIQIERSPEKMALSLFREDELEGRLPELGLDLLLPTAKGLVSFAARLGRNETLRFVCDTRSATCESIGSEAGRGTIQIGSIREPNPHASSLRFAAPRDNPWCQAKRHRDWLRGIIEEGGFDAGPQLWMAHWYASKAFERRYGDERPLSARIKKASTSFRFWAPFAAEVRLLLYATGQDSPPLQEHGLAPIGKGSWEFELPGDLHGRYYSFRVKVFGRWRVTVDPFARSAGANGKRGLIVDFARLEPPGWETFRAPILKKPNDAVIYELHLRDLSCGRGWNGPENLRGSFEAATLTGTSNEGEGRRVATGLDHIRALGVSHVQLLPIFDFGSVDETRGADPAYRTRRRGGIFNWGYDPLNFCAPEGSYSTDPESGGRRVLELRNLIMRFGEGGQGVVMDVVYNHVPKASDSPLDVGAPGYFFRPLSFSGAGQDIASERPMVRRFILDSLVGWLRDYRLSGFRFDLMGLLDIKTMRALARALRREKRDLLLYGEGWDMYRDSAMEGASQISIRRLPRIAMFNDALRDAIKGSVFEATEPGFIHEGTGLEALRFGIVGAVRHPQVDNSRVRGAANPGPWTARSSASISYAEIHDNLTLADKNRLASPSSDEDALAELQQLALGIILLAQGIPILHAGGEFLRSKEIPAEWLADIEEGNMPPLPDLDFDPDGRRAFSHNSYDLSDEVNAIDWRLALRHRETVDWVRGLIALRRAHPLFRLERGAAIRRRLRFMEAEEPLLAWTIRGGMGGESWEEALVVLCPDGAARTFSLPGRGAWLPVALEGKLRSAAEKPLPSGQGLWLKPRSLSLFARPKGDRT